MLMCAMVAYACKYDVYVCTYGRGKKIRNRGLAAARAQQGCPLGECKAVAYLVYRPSGPTVDGGQRASGWAFVAFDVDKLLAWQPQSQRPSSTLALLGNFVKEGKGEEPESLERAPPPVRLQRPDRWELLRETKSRNGWCAVLDFVDVFGLAGRGDPKHAANRISKRLREHGCELKNAPKGKGRPPKSARVCDLQRCHSDLQ